jgi:VanZ family protein
MKKIKTSATPISWVYALVIIYASLFPFTGWRNQSIYPWEFLWAPLPLYWTAYDIYINILGYIPLGFVLTLADLRVNKNHGQVWSYNWIYAVALSLILESLQTYLPTRVPSSIDFLLNCLGTLIGVWVAYFFEKHRFIDTWNQIRSRWLIKDSVGPLACLLTWPLAIIYPPSIPFLMGDIYGSMKKEAYTFLGLEPISGLLSNLNATAVEITNIESIVCIVTGLLIPITLSFSIVPKVFHRLCVALGICILGASALILSSALTFDVTHIFSWFSAYTNVGYLLAVTASLMFLNVSTKTAQYLLLFFLLIHLLLPKSLSSDVYLAQSIQIWEQGKNARYFGLTQWVGLVWPYIVLVLVLYRVFEKYILKIRSLNKN